MWIQDKQTVGGHHGVKGIEQGHRGGEIATNNHPWRRLGYGLKTLLSHLTRDELQTLTSLSQLQPISGQQLPLTVPP